MSQDQPLTWKSSLGGSIKLGEAESHQGSSKAGKTVLARLMESQILHQLGGSVGRGFRKGTMASACLDTRHFSYSLHTTGAFQAATLVLELRE